MAKLPFITSALIIAVPALLSACATVPKLHSLDTLATVATRCGVGETELAQAPARPGILYFLTLEPREDQLRCVSKWARKHGHALVFVEAYEQQTEQAEP